MGHSSFAEKRQPPKSCEENNLMNKRTLCRLISVLAALVMALSLLTGCSTKRTEQAQEQEDAQTIQVYLWTNALYETYAPYIQSQLPDVNIEFIVGNNDLDFYKFLQQNGGLPDIITCCRCARMPTVLWSTAAFLSSTISRCPPITRALLRPVRRLKR